MAGFDAVKAGVTVLLRHYAAALAMPSHAAAYAEAIAPACWDAFPRGSKLHRPAVFAEVVSFHAMRAAGVPVDPVAIRSSSLVGHMPMTSRHWLLRYVTLLPPALRVARPDPSPEAWLSRMSPCPAVDAARAVLAEHGAALACLRPRSRAGAAVVVAWKRLGIPRGTRPSIADVLGPARISLATAYNAAVRAGLVSRGCSRHARTAADPVATA